MAMPERGRPAADPALVRERREAARLSRKRLGALIAKQVPGAPPSEKTIQRIEEGKPVDPRHLAGVEIRLGLRPAPSLHGPRPDEAAGAWVRALREAHGLSKAAICEAAGNRYGGTGL